MSTLNGQNNEHDQELLQAIEQIVQQETHTPHDARSPLGVGARLAATVPKPDTAFADQLEARLVAAAAQPKEASMRMIESQRPPADRHMGTSSKRRAPHAILRIAAVCSAALVLLVGLVAAVPPARAAIENFVQQFGLELVDPSALAPKSAEGALLLSEVIVPQKLNFEEAQRRTPFPILLPTRLPAGVEMMALDVGEGAFGCSGSTEECANAKPPVGVTVMYDKPGDTSSGIILQATATTLQRGGGFVVDGSEAESATVNGLPAIYAGDSESSILSWEQNGQTYVLQVAGLGLNRDDMIRIAESLR